MNPGFPMIPDWPLNFYNLKLLKGFQAISQTCQQPGFPGNSNSCQNFPKKNSIITAV